MLDEAATAEETALTASSIPMRCQGKCFFIKVLALKTLETAYYSTFLSGVPLWLGLRSSRQNVDANLLRKTKRVETDTTGLRLNPQLTFLGDQSSDLPFRHQKPKVVPQLNLEGPIAQRLEQGVTPKHSTELGNECGMFRRDPVKLPPERLKAFFDALAPERHL
jgi:hypothetical protein